MVSVSTDSEAAARRLQLALDFFRTGEEMMRQRLRREHPGISPQDLEARLVAWLETRPGAVFGDASGRPVPWPRRGR
jgi:hypothetical protein